MDEVAEFNELEEIEAEIKSKKKKPFIIRENDTWKNYWDTVILILALFNSITIPISLTFDDLS